MVNFDNLDKRYEQSFESRDVSPRNSILNIKGVKFYKHEEEKANLISVVPYEIATEKHPLVANKKAPYDVGDPDYFLDIYVHRNVGVQKQDVVCLAKNYGRHCPICQERETSLKNGDEETAKALKPKRRVFYNVIDENEGDEEIKILEASHYLFEKPLIEWAKKGVVNDDKNHVGRVNFAHPLKGFKIEYYTEKETTKLGNYLKFIRFSFLKRKPLKKTVLTTAYQLDKYIEVLTEEEIEDLIYHVTDETNVESETYEQQESKEREKEEDFEIKKQEDFEINEECPYGLDFGVDFDEYPNCDNCKKRGACEEFNRGE